MTLLRRPLCRLLLALGLAAWLLSGLAAQVHKAMVQHVVCPEHGEVVELSQADDAEEGPALTAASPAPEHAHGCAMDPALLAGLPTAATPAPGLPEEVPAAALLACSQAPRGPPLAYAPKTSPPASA